jgi:hypothetical protein
MFHRSSMVINYDTERHSVSPEPPECPKSPNLSSDLPRRAEALPQRQPSSSGDRLCLSRGFVAPKPHALLPLCASVSLWFNGLFPALFSFWRRKCPSIFRLSLHENPVCAHLCAFVRFTKKKFRAPKRRVPGHSFKSLQIRPPNSAMRNRFQARISELRSQTSDLSAPSALSCSKSLQDAHFTRGFPHPPASQEKFFRSDARSISLSLRASVVACPFVPIRAIRVLLLSVSCLLYLRPVFSVGFTAAQE